MADVESSLDDWSTTPASNKPTGSTTIGTNLDDNLREIQAVVRYQSATDTIASATTTDLSTKEARFISVTGTTTITGLGTVTAGISKWLIFGGVLTFTHNGTSLILPGAANITTAAGDCCLVESLGSGNWRCLAYTSASAIFDADLYFTKAGDGQYYENLNTVAASGAAETLTLTENSHDVTLTGNCTFTFPTPTSGKNFSFTLILRQDATGSRTVTWPASVDWPSATAPTISSGASDVDVYTFMTVDGGTTWLGFTAGQDMS